MLRVNSDSVFPYVISYVFNVRPFKHFGQNYTRQGFFVIITLIVLVALEPALKMASEFIDTSN